MSSGVARVSVTVIPTFSITRCDARFSSIVAPQTTRTSRSENALSTNAAATSDAYPRPHASWRSRYPSSTSSSGPSRSGRRQNHPTNAPLSCSCAANSPNRPPHRS